MLTFNAHEFICLTEELTIAACRFTREEKPIGDAAKDLAEALSETISHAELINATICLARLKRLKERMENHPQLAGDEVAQELKLCIDLAHEQMSEKLFLFIPSDRAKFYQQPEPLFGKEVFDAFPSAVDDVAEAGKCLATDRATACVFHMMRVMEAGLKALAKALKIAYAPSWESYLKQIDSQIQIKHQKKSRAWKRDEPFFREAAAHLSTVKFAWRNPTMHIVKHYTPESAEEIYNSVRAFMRHLATKLKEKA